MAVAPKDGHLYGFDLADSKLLYRAPVTRVENVEEPFSPDKNVHFCPGSGGGTEWNSPAYDPRTNLIFVGDVDWCVTVRVQTKEELQGVAAGQPWFGNHMLNPFDVAGEFSSPDTNWAGWIHAVDADTGVWKWRLKADYPIVAAVTPTAGGLVFFGDVGGDLYAVNAETGEKLWGQKLGGPLGGGVITYSVNGVQKVAVATGLVNPLWAVPVRTGKIAILGLEGGASQ
jgi:alcohol dehydrogenase (cytochrome c)